jgi:hypothetical protein
MLRRFRTVEGEEGFGRFEGRPGGWTVFVVFFVDIARRGNFDVIRC